jgi:hyperosmotically inducible periplasmic protein
MKNLVIALLLGIILGAAGYWFILQPPVQEAAQRAEQKAADAGKAVSGAADEAKRAVTAKLEVLQLRAQEIRDELQKTGRVVRRKARDVGETVADAAADARITAEIKRKLAADPELSAFTVSVSTTDGRVTLSGSVSSPELVGKAILLAMETEGVREVVSTLQVK